MEEKELVPAKSVHDDLLEAFRVAAHTNDLENKIKSLEETVAKREEELKNKEKEAEAAKSKFPLWVTSLCWFLALFQFWPGIIAYFCFRSHYRKTPTKQGLQAQAKALQEADDMKQKLEKLKQDLNNMKASFESSVEELDVLPTTKIGGFWYLQHCLQMQVLLCFLLWLTPQPFHFLFLFTIASWRILPLLNMRKDYTDE